MTNPPDLVEAVARAICRANCYNLPQDQIETQVHNGHDLWIREAQAAIAAYEAAKGNGK